MKGVNMPEEQTIITFKYKDREVKMTDEQMDEVADQAEFVGDVMKDAIQDSAKESHGNFIHIGPKVAHQIGRDIAALLRENLQDIDVAYTEAEDGLKITFGVKFSTPKNLDGVKIETGITFIKEKITSGKVAVVDEKQGGLFD